MEPVNFREEINRLEAAAKERRRIIDQHTQLRAAAQTEYDAMLSAQTVLQEQLCRASAEAALARLGANGSKAELTSVLATVARLKGSLVSTGNALEKDSSILRAITAAHLEHKSTGSGDM